ncbi:hypothetical protein HaLaN_25041, partial [Haematococcus lacustris]
MQGDAARGIHRSTLGTLGHLVHSGGAWSLWSGTQASVLR